MKAVVFDVDETLGSFTQLFIVWKILNKYLQKNNLLPNLIHTQLLFDFLLDIFPLYLRPKILNVFQYLAEQKQQGNIQKVILFTNNQISKEWIQWIAKYIENKMRMKIFDKIIYAYKIKNHFVESERSSHEKLYKDLIKIGQLQNYQICFVDDLLHKKMLHPNVFYIHISPYSHYYSLNFILDSLHKHLKLNKVPFYFFVNKEYHKILFEIPSHSPHYPLLQQIKEFVELSPQGK